MAIRTGGGNGGYSRKSAVSKGNPRTPKNATPSGARTAQRKAEDGTRQNGKK